MKNDKVDQVLAWAAEYSYDRPEEKTKRLQEENILSALYVHPDSFRSLRSVFPDTGNTELQVLCRQALRRLENYELSMTDATVYEIDAADDWVDLLYRVILVCERLKDSVSRDTSFHPTLYGVAIAVEDVLSSLSHPIHLETVALRAAQEIEAMTRGDWNSEDVAMRYRSWLKEFGAVPG